MTTRGHGFTYPDKPRPDDRVAVLSPSMGLPAVFPTVYEQGLRRIREVFGLVPVEYPTTRTMNAPLRERACDVHAAFADPTVKAIITSIGGEDQIKLLRYLDPELIGAHPKPFFGYSDNTNLHVFLWNLGIVSYHGGSVMVQLGRGGAMHPYTAASLRQALFERGEAKISPAPEYTDEDLDWAESGTLTREPPMFTNPGWTWLNGGRIVEGIAWGGSLEIVDFHLRAGKYLLPLDAYEGAILYLETSEELPSATYVYRVLMCMAERGLLQRFPAVLVARPKAWSLERPNTAKEKARFTVAQEEAVRRVLHEYHPRALAVFNLDFGHTDPNLATNPATHRGSKVGGIEPVGRRSGSAIHRGAGAATVACFRTREERRSRRRAARGIEHGQDDTPTARRADRRLGAARAAVPVARAAGL